MIDVSDGLLQDLGHLGAFSYLGMDIDSSRLPIAASLRTYGEANGVDPKDFVCHGGEDYELVFTVAADEADALLDAFHHEFRLETTRIGTVTDKWLGVRVDGQQANVGGFDHFKTPA